MLDGLQFKVVGPIERCGTEIEPDAFIEPMLDGSWPDCTTAISTELPASWNAQFDYDLLMSMMGLTLGYDPYNHVGDNIVAEVIGAMNEVPL